MNLILGAAWFLLPAMVSNMMPVWAKKIPLLDKYNTPIDGGKKIQGKRLLGDNKTYRGFIAGIGAAIMIGGVQYILAGNISFLQELEFSEELLGLGDYLLLSFLLGIGALVGDAVESLAKRQLNVKPGAAFFPFDQLDYIFGAIALSTPVIKLSSSQLIAVVIVGFSLHLISTLIGYRLGLKDAPI